MRKLENRAALLILTGGLLMLLLSGCTFFAGKYPVQYDSKCAYENARDSYRAGTLVKLRLAVTATDTDYFYSVTGADGATIPLEHIPGYDIAFRMPEQAVSVMTESRNSMLPGPES